MALVLKGELTFKSLARRRGARQVGRMPNSFELLHADGTFNRAPIMREAHTRFKIMRRHNWSFGKCLSISWAAAKAERAVRAEPAMPIPVPIPTLHLGRPSLEGVVELTRALTGREPSPAALARLRQALTARMH
jgi:hypothetical protein